MNRHDLDALDQQMATELTEHFEAEARALAPAPLDASALWEQGRNEGRRARRRTVLQVVAASAVVMLLAGLSFWPMPTVLDPAFVPTGGALPEVVHLPNDTALLESPPSDSLRTGRLSVITALHTNPGIVMGVTAESGTHLRLTLEDAVLSTESMNTGPVMALSRDGSQLAWAHRKRVGEPSVEYGGVSVADLETGAVSTFEVRGGAGELIAVSALSFSPDGTRIAWYGPSYTPELGVSEETFGGRIDLTGSASGEPTFTAGAPRPGNSWDPLVAVENDGTVSVLQGNEDLHGYPNSTAESLGDAVSAPTFPPADGGGFPHGLAAHPVGTGLAVGHSDFETSVFTLSATSIPKFPGQLVRATAHPPQWTLPPGSGDIRLMGLSPAGAAVVSTKNGLRRLELRDVFTPTDAPLLAMEGMQSVGTTLVALDLADTTPVDFRTPSWATWWSKLWHSGPWWIWLVPIAGLIAIGVSMSIFIRNYRGVAHPRQPKTLSPRAARAYKGLYRTWRVFYFGCEMVVIAVLIAMLVVTIKPVLPTGEVQSAPDGAFPTRATPYDWNELTSLDGAPPAASGAISMTSNDYTGSPRPIGTDATTGAHVQPGLEGWDANQQWTRLALDPDGRRIAYAWHNGQDDFEPSGTDDLGLAVHDVVTGETTHEVLTTPAGHRIYLNDIVWSPDGQWVAWEGRAKREDRKKKGRQLWVGITSSDDLASARWTYPSRYEHAIAAAPDGTLLTLTSNRLRTFSAQNGDEPVRTDEIATQGLAWHGAAVSPDGTQLAVGLGGENMDAFATGVRLIDLNGGARTLRTHPWTTTGYSTVLGRSPKGAIIVASSEDSDLPERVLALRPNAGDEEDWLTVLKPGALGYHASGFSVATSLADRPSVDFGTPPIPLTGTRIAGIALLLALLALMVTPYVKRARRAWAKGRDDHHLAGTIEA